MDYEIDFNENKELVIHIKDSHLTKMEQISKENSIPLNAWRHVKYFDRSIISNNIVVIKYGHLDTYHNFTFNKNYRVSSFQLYKHLRLFNSSTDPHTVVYYAFLDGICDIKDEPKWIMKLKLPQTNIIL